MLTDRLEHPVEHAAVIGASFIALETAAALRARDVKVTVGGTGCGTAGEDSR